jgi:hypothetical protein
MIGHFVLGNRRRTPPRTALLFSDRVLRFRNKARIAASA